jgi:hypothetical protein
MVERDRRPLPLRRRQGLIVGLVGLAQVLEMADKGVYSDFILSGHTLKHVVAGLATLAIYRWRSAA